MSSARIANIVFTKNRPLQLHGYLESLRRFLPARMIQTYILYKPQLFDSEYQTCFSLFPDCHVIRETNFYRNFLDLFESLNTEYILFGIDDLAWFNNVESETIEKTFSRLGNQLFGFSLRLDSQQMPEDAEAGNICDYDIDGQTIHTIDWTKGHAPAAQYPFELCATIYRTAEIRRLFSAVVSQNYFANRYLYPDSDVTNLYGKIFKVRNLYKQLGFFYNPNTLESWCCRFVQNHPDRFGHLLAYQKICASAIQVNMVNTSTANQWDNAVDLTVENLAEKYRNGFRLDIDWLSQNRPLNTHSDAAYFRLKGGTTENVKIL